MRYYILDKEIYYQNEKQPPRLVELFFINKNEDKGMFSGYDKDGNLYKLKLEELIEKEI